MFPLNCANVFTDPCERVTVKTGEREKPNVSVRDPSEWMSSFREY